MDLSFIKFPFRLIHVLTFLVYLCGLPGVVTAATITDNSPEEFTKGSLALQNPQLNQKITLEEAQNIALQNSDAVENAMRKARIVSHRYQQLSKQYFPDFNLKTGIYKRNGDVEANQDGLGNKNVDELTSYVELRAAMPWGSKKGQLKDAESAEKDKSIAHEQYLDQVKELRLRIHNAYFDLVLNNKLLSLAQESYRIAEARRTQFQEKYILGTCSKVDLFSEESNVLANVAAVESAQSSLDDKFHDFFAQINIPPVKNIILIDELQFTPYEKKRDLDIDKTVSVNTTQQRLQIEKSEIVLEKYQQSWFPKLSVYLGYRNTNGERDGLDTKGEYYGALLEVPFPSRGGSDAVEAARLEKTGALKALRQAEATYLRQITSLERQIEQAEKRIRIDGQLMFAKKREIELQRANFELGKISSIELNVVEATAINVEQQYLRNVYKHMKIVAELKNLLTQEK